MFGLVLAITAGAVWSSVLLAVGLILLVACANMLMWRRVELWPITPEAARRSKHASFWGWIAWVLLAFLQ